jgi:hypothetical protein
MAICRPSLYINIFYVSIELILNFQYCNNHPSRSNLLPIHINASLVSIFMS